MKIHLLSSRLLMSGLLFGCVPACSAPNCESSGSDADGDGWGWENNASCVVEQAAASGSTANCTGPSADPDGDGWGWENGASCRVSGAIPNSAADTSASDGSPAGLPADVVICTSAPPDHDNDGWAYEYGYSCILPAAADTLSPQAAIGQLSSSDNGQTPVGVRFLSNTLKRVGGTGDNWCQTWASDDSVITAMDDGEWMTSEYKYHSRLYKIHGESNDFSVHEVQNYPEFHTNGDGWFAYGVLSLNGVYYSLVSKTQTGAWAEGPFRGMKMLRSYDDGNTWSRVDQNNNDRYLARSDTARELLSHDEMFFFEESGRTGQGKEAYPFAYASFVQRGRDHSEASDGYVYIYSPEGANSHQLLLARAPVEQLGQRSAWQYFSGWNDGAPTWNSSLERRQANLVFPEKNSHGEYFGWYSWLPSVVFNKGLGVYIMASGGTYAGHGMTNSTTDYYDKWMHTKSGSLGLWYSENPYGPWKRFYYTEHWTADDGNNLTYQPKLSPKWISDDGRTMTLVWSDAMRNADGYSHSVNYKWNQMQIEIQTE